MSTRGKDARTQGHKDTKCKGTGAHGTREDDREGV